MNKIYVLVVILALTGCMGTTDPFGRGVEGAASMAAVGCATGAAMTIWAGPVAAVGCGMGAMAGAAVGAMAGAATATTPAVHPYP